MSDKKTILSPAQRAAVISQISAAAESNPAYKKHVEERLEHTNNPAYLTHAHQVNSEAVTQEIVDSKKSPASFDEAQRQVLQNSGYLTEAHRKNSEAAMKTLSEQTPCDLDQAIKEMQETSKGRRFSFNEPYSEPQYLTEGHKANEEAVMRQAAINKTLPIDWDQESERQKKNSETQHLTEAHRANSEAAMKHLQDVKKLPIDWEKEAERQKRNSQDQ